MPKARAQITPALFSTLRTLGCRLQDGAGQATLHRTPWGQALGPSFLGKGKLGRGSVPGRGKEGSGFLNLLFLGWSSPSGAVPLNPSLEYRQCKAFREPGAEQAPLPALGSLLHDPDQAGGACGGCCGQMLRLDTTDPLLMLSLPRGTHKAPEHLLPAHSTGHRGLGHPHSLHQLTSTMS